MHTLSSAARAVGIAKSTIYRAVKAGRCRRIVFRAEHTRFIPETSVARFRQSSRPG